MAAGNPNYDSLMSTTLNEYRSEFTDNLSNSFFLFWWLNTQGRKKLIDGGKAITIQLMYGLNSTVRTYDGYETLDTTPQEGLTAVDYPWKQLSGSIAISRKEERQNSGKHRLINLLQSKIEQTEITMRDVLNRQFFGDGTGNDSKDFFGLDLLVENGSAWGTLGGIDRNDPANAWWRNQWIGSVGAFGTAFAGLNAMRQMYNLTSRGNEHPDIGITTSDIHQAFEASQVGQQRFTDDRILNSHFELLKFKGMILGYDENCPTGAMFFLNSRYLEYIVDKETDLVPTEFVRPDNQDAKVAQILLMGNLTSSNSARQGRLDGITVP